MSTVTHREMRNHSGDLLRRVEQGESVTVTNHGRPVAVIRPIGRTTLDELEEQGQIRKAVRSLRRLREIVRVKSDLPTSELIAESRGDR